MGLLSYNEEDDKFNDDDDVWVVEGDDITRERNAFDASVDEDDDKLAFLLKKMFR